MSSRATSSLKELRNLREAVLAEEKAKTQALLQNLPPNAFPVTTQQAAANDTAFEEPVPTVEVDDVLIPNDSDNELEAPSLEAEAEEAPPPPPPKTPTPRPPAPAPPPQKAEAAPARPAPPVNRSKPPNKEPALIIPLTPKIQERLQKHVQDSRWSPAELVMELIRSTLHQGYPAIQYGDQIIARSGTFRTFERNPLDTSLKIISGQGIFTVAARPEHADFQNWMAYYASQDSENAETLACQACLASLQNHLESFEDFRLKDWTKRISPEAFSISPAG